MLYINMPASMRKVKKPMLHVRRLDGNIIQDYDQSQSHIKFLPDGKRFICTCGNEYSDIGGFYMHKKTLTHLILTKQIQEYHPTLSPNKQRDILLSSGKRIW